MCQYNDTANPTRIASQTACVLQGFAIARLVALELLAVLAIYARGDATGLQDAPATQAGGLPSQDEPAPSPMPLNPKPTLSRG